MIIEKEVNLVQLSHQPFLELEMATTLEIALRKLPELLQLPTLKVNQNFKIR
jgi:hypothetical protein